MNVCPRSHSSRRRSRHRLDLESLEARELLACADLTAIELPDVEIRSARELGNVPRYCRVIGRIEETINFQVRMPVDPEWNGKFLMYGIGGYAGSIPEEVTSNTSALRKGYAIAGTDTGHQGGGQPTWALNNTKAQEDFAYRAVHLTAVTAKEIIQSFYQADIAHSYFTGCSGGGRQGMIEAQRFPEDFDGIVAGAPWIDPIGQTVLRNVWIQQAMYPDPHTISRPTVPNSKLSLLGRKTLEKCDGADGLMDGLIENPQACSFVPSVDLPVCPEGTDDRNCFTMEQVATIERVLSDELTDASGRSVPVFPPGYENEAGGWNAWVTDVRPAWSTLLGDMPNFHYFFAQGQLRYFVFGDPAYQLQDFNYQTDLEKAAQMAAMLGATDPDMTRFKEAGGKILFYHGWADHALSALRTIQYLEDVVTAMDGPDNVTDFARLFMMPGVLHCGGGPGPDTVDWLTALERWVEEDIPPDSLVASGGTPYRTRPACPYPQQAIWDGVGDPNKVTSFSCGVVPTFTPGDANRDGLFDSSDLVQVFQRGEYEDGIEDNSDWEDGDWNGDKDFDSSDLVMAFQTGLYEQPLAAPATIFQDDPGKTSEGEGIGPMSPEILDAIFALEDTLKERPVFVA